MQRAPIHLSLSSDHAFSPLLDGAEESEGRPHMAVSKRPLEEAYLRGQVRRAGMF